MECQYCNKTFQYSSKLKYHQNNIKYCLDLQKNQLQKQTQKVIPYTNNELQIYNSSLEQTIRELKNTIETLQLDKSKLESKIDEKDAIIKEIAQKTKRKTNTRNTNSNNNNTTNNIINMYTLNLKDTEKMRSLISQHLTKEVLAEGQAGLAKMMGEIILKSPNGELLYKCTDVSRQKFVFTNENGEQETDPSANKLIDSMTNSGLNDSIITARDDLYQENGVLELDKVQVYSPAVNEVSNLKANSSTFRSKLSSITAK